MKKILAPFLLSVLFVALPSICSAAAPSEASAIILVPPMDYEVKKGDTLWNISKEIYHSGKYWQKIFKANNLVNSKSGQPVVVEGRKIKIPALAADEVMDSVYVWTEKSVDKNSSTSFSGQSAAQSEGKILYRIVKDCATGRPTGEYHSEKYEFEPNQFILGYLQIIDLDKFDYGNYTCRNRYHQQCVADGSFDVYYEEWCSASAQGRNDFYGQSEKVIGEMVGKEAPVLSSSESLSGLISSLITGGSELLKNKEANYSNDVKDLILFRVARDCATGKPTGKDYPELTNFGPGRWIIHHLQMVYLDSADYYNYNCQPRYQEQCIDDGSFDSYYDEMCVRK